MKRLIRGVTLFAILPLAPAALAQAVQPEAFFELEGATLPSGWSTGTDPATGVSYATVTGKPTVPVTDQTLQPLTLTVSSNRYATYHVWVRVIAQDSGSDSFYAALGNNTFGYFDTGNYFGSDGVWKKLGSVALAPGGSTAVQLKYRESNLKFDKLIITALPTYTPTGVGTVPAASNAIPTNPYAYTPEILPTGAHPRLYLGNSNDRNAILATKAMAAQSSATKEHVRVRDAWSRLKSASESVLSVPTTLDDCNTYAKAIAGKALFYQLEGNTAIGQAAVTMMRNYVDACAFEEPEPGKRIPLTTRRAGDMISLIALVYDWCFPYVTPADRDLFMRRFLELAPMEIGFPPENQGHLVGHGSEHQLLRDQISAAIAFYDEEPRFYEIVGAKFFRDFVPARKDYLYKSGAFHQGPSYGHVRYFSDLFAAWIFRRMAGVDVFENSGKEMLQYTQYMRRPDGQIMRDGDTFDSTYAAVGRYWQQSMIYLLAANFYKDPALKNEYLRQLAAKGDNSILDPWSDDLWHVLFSDLTVSAANVSLPLSKFYGEPSGYMVARTAWPTQTVDFSSNAVVATMKVGHTNFANHQHLDAGHFQLYYKGGLAIDSGIYEGKNGDVPSLYGDPHDRNYHKRTIAHNAMLVFQPGEKFGNAESNDGGQRYITLEPKSLEVLRDPEQHYQYGGNIRHRIGPDANQPAFSYLKGDLHGAYTEKVANYQRSFVFLNLGLANVPAALVVFDRIRSSHPTYQKRWLLHSVGEPQIDETGKTVTIQRTDNNYNGKLVNSTLLPTQVIYAKRGLPGEEHLAWNTDGTALVNYPTTPQRANNSEEAGPWRVEVSPSAPQEADVMLNVMQVMDANSTAQPLATTSLDSPEFVGAKIHDRVVLFAKAETGVGTSASFTLPGAISGANVLVTDLDAGTWELRKTGVTKGQQFLVALGDGTIYVPNLSAGSYTLQRTGL